MAKHHRENKVLTMNERVANAKKSDLLGMPVTRADRRRPNRDHRRPSAVKSVKRHQLADQRPLFYTMGFQEASMPQISIFRRSTERDGQLQQHRVLTLEKPCFCCGPRSFHNLMSAERYYPRGNHDQGY